MNELDQNLLTDEAIVFQTTKHWFAPVRDSAIAVLVLLGSFVLRWLAPSGDGAIIGGIGNIFQFAANIALVVAIVWIAWNVFAFFSAHFGVSTMRVLRYEGIIQRRTSETLLSAVTDVRLREPALGRMLGYGDLQVLTSAGEAGKDAFHTVRDAAKMRTAILEQKTAGLRPAAAAMPDPPPQTVVPVDAVADGRPPAPVAPSSIVDQSAADLAKLAELRDQGLITNEDFEAKKTEILARI